MKATFTMLALAALAFAQDLAPRWPATTTTWTVLTTTTVCPVTSTKTEVSFKSHYTLKSEDRMLTLLPAWNHGRRH